MRRSFETISGMIFNRLHPKFAAESVENEMLCLKAMCTDRSYRTSFDAWFEDFLSNLLLKVIIYCVTGQSSITRSRRSVLNFKFSDLTFLRSMSCSMSCSWALCKDIGWNWNIFCLQNLDIDFHTIFAPDLAATFGCFQFRIMPDIVFKLLCTAI